MSTMHHYDTSSVRVAVASLLGTLTAFGLNGAVVAAGTCMEGPNLNAGQGLHWYYRVDRISHRKCWYVMETGLKANEAPPSEPTHSPTTLPYFPLFSWFAPLGGGPPGSASVGMQPNITIDVPSAAPRETLKVVHAVRSERSRQSASAGMQSSATKESLVPPAAGRGNMKFVHAARNEWSRPAETKSTATAERNQSSPSLLSAERAEQVNSQSPDQAAQDALFLEFLRWNELRKSMK
jgi:hypothetical protein